MRQRWFSAVLGVGAALSLMGIWWAWPSEPNVAGALPLARANVPAGSRVAPSLEGTTPDGVAHLEALQELPGTATGGLPYGALRRMFDYYLSTVGEQTVDGIAEQIRQEIVRTMDARRAPMAQRLLARYLDFKRELFTLEQQFAKQTPGAQGLRQRFEAMQTLRSRFFNAEEEQAMFGLEDAADLDALARLDIANNPALTAAEKREQLASLDAAMPKALRDDREAPRAVLMLEEKARKLRAQGGSDDDVYRLRAQTLDAAAASRLADVDREELAWRARIDQYLSEKSSLMQKLADTPDAERSAAISGLQQSRFSELERKRLAAYEP